MILLTAYLAIGLVFSMYIYTREMMTDRFEGIRPYFEEKYEGVSFQTIVIMILVLYVLLWPGYLAIGLKKNV